MTTKTATVKKIQAPLYALDGKKTRDVTLPAEIFDVRVSGELITRAVVAQRAASRVTLAHTKTRAERQGGGRKPWKQKGTGRARQGSVRSPQWRKGGVVFGPRNNANYELKINKKERQQAIRGALSSALSREDGLMFLEDLKLKEIKTKVLVGTLAKLPTSRSVLLVLPEHDATIESSARNIQNLKIQIATNLNVVDLLKHRHVVVFEKALDLVTKTYGEK